MFLGFTLDLKSNDEASARELLFAGGWGGGKEEMGEGLKEEGGGEGEKTARRRRKWDVGGGYARSGWYEKE